MGRVCLLLGDPDLMCRVSLSRCETRLQYRTQAVSTAHSLYRTQSLPGLRFRVHLAKLHA
jgi:hypothetical protein